MTRGRVGVIHGGRRTSRQEFGVGTLTQIVPPGFQKYPSDFIKTRHFERKILFLWGGPGPHSSPQLNLLDPPLRPQKFQSDLRLWRDRGSGGGAHPSPNPSSLYQMSSSSSKVSVTNYQLVFGLYRHVAESRRVPANWSLLQIIYN